MLFKKFFIRRKTKHAVRNNTVSRENISFKNAKSVGIIYTWEGKRKTEIINDFAKELENSGKKVQLICYSRVDLRIIPVNINFFNEKDFTFFGNIKGNRLREFADAQFDFLYHLDTMHNTYIENIMALSKARCRVSRADHSRKEVYDFMIQTRVNTGIENLCNEILHYTKALVNNV